MKGQFGLCGSKIKVSDQANCCLYRQEREKNVRVWPVVVVSSSIDVVLEFQIQTTTALSTSPGV